MLVSGRRLLLAIMIIIASVGTVLVLRPDLYGRVLAAIIVICGLIGILALNLLAPARHRAIEEADDVDALSHERLRELMRGTSMHLKRMEYRYSVRSDPNESRDRRCFTAEVNTVRLGFTPAIITDNTNGREGPGYVAFVYDGRRWRGPGLPCPDGQMEAVRHAARCVSPLSKEEETKFDDEKA
jgi:hypothetical protein